MNIGLVKWFNNAKGYGFIVSENNDGDIFAHYTEINMDGYKTLKAGQKVQYATKDGPKGVHAIDIQAIEESTVQTASDQTTKVAQPQLPARSSGEEEITQANLRAHTILTDHNLVRRVD